MQTINSALTRTMLASLAIFCASAASAQAITTISNSSAARDCYSAAARAATHFAASQEDLATCTRALDEELLTRTDKARTYINRGIVQSALERYQNALADYNAASALMPQMPEAFISRGNLWYLAEKYDRASSEYTAAMQMDFSRAHIAYYNRGLTNEKMGKRDAAIADFKEALKLQPELKLAKDRLEVLARNPSQ